MSDLSLVIQKLLALLRTRRRTVNPSPPVIITSPVITSNATISQPENSGLILSLTADRVVAWSIVGGEDQAMFTLSSGSFLVLSPRNFEDPQDANQDNTYIVQIKATDQIGNTATQTISVIITNVDENAPVITSPNAFSTPEDGFSAFQWQLTSNKPSTWSIVGGADQAFFQFGNTLPDTSQFINIGPKDSEAPIDSDHDSVYVVIVRATAIANGLFTDQTISVTVTDVVDNTSLYPALDFTDLRDSMYVGTMIGGQ